jgi:hypothetical protein
MRRPRFTRREYPEKAPDQMTRQELIEQILPVFDRFGNSTRDGVELGLLAVSSIFSDAVPTREERDRGVPLIRDDLIALVALHEFVGRAVEGSAQALKGYAGGQVG